MNTGIVAITAKGKNGQLKILNPSSKLLCRIFQKYQVWRAAAVDVEHENVNDYAYSIFKIGMSIITNQMWKIFYKEHKILLLKEQNAIHW